MKRTLYPKLLGGYLIYGLICFIIISTFGYHITFNFLERRMPRTALSGVCADFLQLCRELFQTFHDIRGNENTALYFKHLPLQ